MKIRFKKENIFREFRRDFRRPKHLAIIESTDSGIVYRVDFELDSNPYFTAYWFNLANPQHNHGLTKSSPASIAR